MPPDDGRIHDAAVTNMTVRVIAALEARGCTKHGDELRFRCVAHDDTTASADFNVMKAVWSCLACGSSGGVRDLAARLGLAKVVALQPSRSRGGGGVSPKTAPQSCNRPGLRLVQYAEAKQLPIDFLQALGLEDVHINGTPVVKIPFRDVGGQELAARFRWRLEKRAPDDRFTWRKKSKVHPYGLDRLDRARAAGTIVLVEGESDCHTLWHHDVPALGVPGAGTWKPAWGEYLDDIADVMLLVEPDQGGATLLDKIMRTPSIGDRVRLVELGDLKDPSELHQRDPAGFRAAWASAVERARRLTDVRAEAQNAAAAAAWAACVTLAREPDLLAVFERDLGRLGVVGHGRIAKIVFLATISRFFERPISIAVKGPSSAGKSFEVERTLDFFPPSAFYTVTAMSERALAYSEEPLAHRMLVIFEAAGMAGDFASYLIRSLLSEGRLRYETVEKTPEGLKARLIEREGPTGLITTTTAVRLHPENETRLLSVGVDDTPDQTKRVFHALARTNGTAPAPVDFAPWHALQTWLANLPPAVVIPFDTILADMVPAVAVRQRRDFGLLLRLIQAHALLHAATRNRDPEGRVIASLHDYAVIRDLVGDLLGEAVRATVSATMRETVAAVAQLAGGNGAPTSAIATQLKLDHSAAYRRLAAACEAGYVANLETRKGRPGRYAVDEPLPDEIPLLPDVAAIESAIARLHPDCGDNASPLPPSQDGEDSGGNAVTCTHCRSATWRRRADGETLACAGCSAVAHLDGTPL